MGRYAQKALRAEVPPLPSTCPLPASASDPRPRRAAIAGFSRQHCGVHGPSCLGREQLLAWHRNGPQPPRRHSDPRSSRQPRGPMRGGKVQLASGTPLAALLAGESVRLPRPILQTVSPFPPDATGRDATLPLVGFVASPLLAQKSPSTTRTCVPRPRRLVPQDRNTIRGRANLACQSDNRSRHAQASHGACLDPKIKSRPAYRSIRQTRRGMLPPSGTHCCIPHPHQSCVTALHDMNQPATCAHWPWSAVHPHSTSLAHLHVAAVPVFLLYYDDARLARREFGESTPGYHMHFV